MSPKRFREPKKIKIQSKMLRIGVVMLRMND
ncbi:hypothetical protein SAMN04490182_2835 [Pseudomonas cedrina]|uniref:Uncharacterized protein n=1 Tax=Pseudomonas cedrina TaxID=651740 RepID=A0ABY0UNA5_PSECE|nr:hypothetical protein SAMN04490182_2835 [Pseudomonas cedrina]